jgi:hypothetical protein
MYKEYFEQRSISTHNDSVNVLKYHQKLKNIYANIKEVGFGNLPLERIYEMKNYDTTLLFSILKKYAFNREQYNAEIGISRYVATKLITNDAVIKGDVVKKTNDYKDCRYFVSTYFIKVDSIIHSYFPLMVGDTVLIQYSGFGLTSNCNPNQGGSFYSEDVNVKDYEVGEKNLIFLLDRGAYLRQYSKHVIKQIIKYKDPYCFNSFWRCMDMEFFAGKYNDCEKSQLENFIKKIKK